MKINYKDYDISIINNNSKNYDKVFLYLKFYGWDKKNIELDNSIIINITKENIEDYFSPWPALEFKGLGDILVYDIKEIINILKSNDLFKNSKFYLFGYSLGGLASVYLSYLIDDISGFASLSGSLWYPNFMDFIINKNINKNIDRVYLSIGNRDTKGLNGRFKDAINNTKEVAEVFKYKGVKAMFELNEGTHFDNVEERILKGLCYLQKND